MHVSDRMRPLPYIFEPKKVNCSSPSPFFRCKRYQLSNLSSVSFMFLLHSFCLLSLFHSVYYCASLISQENARKKIMRAFCPHTFKDWQINSTIHFLCTIFHPGSMLSHKVFPFAPVKTLRSTSSLMIFFSHSAELLALSCCSCQRQLNLEISMKRKEQYNCIPQKPDV